MLSDALKTIRSQIKEINDDDLFELLDCASEELKRRNGLMAPSLRSIQSQDTKASLASLIEALANFKNQEPGLYIKSETKK